MYDKRDRVGSRRNRLRMAVAFVAVGVGTLVVPCVVFAAGDANTSGCGPQTEASPGFRTYLPDCRAYELVTPPYKEGGVVLAEPAAISGDGEHAIVGAGGATAGAGNLLWDANRTSDFSVYGLTRTESGWQPTALTPSAAQYPRSALLAVSADPTLSTTLWGAETNSLLYDEDIYLREDSGAFVRVGPGHSPEVDGEELQDSDEELDLVGASNDLMHSVYSITAANPHGHSDLWPGDTTQPGSRSLYEYVYGGAPSAEPTLVGVENQEPLKSNGEATLISDCGTELGAPATEPGGPGGPSVYNAVSEDGETVFFTATKCVGGPAVNELYARVGQSKTVWISEPSKADCASCQTSSTETELKNAVFQGASQKGEKVFFLTEQELLPGQKGMNLYEYDFSVPTASSEHPDGKISLVSGGSTDPKVQGVVRVSENGERVYFVANGKLAPKNAEGNEPEEEANNLYVYEPEPGNPAAYRTVFIAKLLTGSEEASLHAAETAEAEGIEKQGEEKYIFALGEIEREEAAGEITSERAGELREQAFQEFLQFFDKALGTRGPYGTLEEDKSVWQEADVRPVQATPEGRFLVFPSSADLTVDDVSTAPQLFEYDAEAGRLTRVSIGQGGTYENDGNSHTFEDAPQIPPQRFREVDLPTAAQFQLALSANGSRVFFTSSAKLTPAAVSGATNVFEYHEGDVYLISDGHDTSNAGNSPAVRFFGVDPAGRNVFFLTADQLVPQDGETQQALYDAREEGGFPPPVLVPGCIGETCRGETGAVPALQSPSSASQVGGGNLPPPVESKPAAKPEPKRMTRAEKLARALKACKAKRNRKTRTSCEAKVRKTYGAKVKATKSTSRVG
jgi:hypothetical protein